MGKRRYKEKACNKPQLSVLQKIRGSISLIANKFDKSGYAGLFLTILIVSIYVISREISSVNNHAQVRFVENNHTMTATEQTNSNAPAADVFAFPKYQAAFRLREAGALGIAVSLAVFSRYSASNQLPRTNTEVIAEAVNRKLMPPGITFKNGNIRSEASILRFNYRVSPLSFEVLSMPIDGHTGESLLFQFPLPPTKAQSVMYFKSPNGRGVPIPFSSAEKLVASGWQISHWDTAELALDESSAADIQEQTEWLRSISPAK